MTAKLPPIISWDDSWSVGLKELDDEHKKLVHIIQTLFGAIITSQGKDYIETIVKELLDYTEYHFQHEESILKEKQYPDLNDQVHCHQLLLENVKSYCQIIKSHQETEKLSDDVYEFLKHWLVDHILEKDILYKQYVS